MCDVQQFFAHLATCACGETTRVVDALAVGSALGLPVRVTLAYVAELGARGWIIESSRSPYGRLHVELTAHGQAHREGSGT